MTLTPYGDDAAAGHGGSGQWPTGADRDAMQGDLARGTNSPVGCLDLNEAPADLSPDGIRCPIRSGERCEIIFADGSMFAGIFDTGIMTGTPGFVQGTTGYAGHRFRSSWDWRGTGDCIPVTRFRIWRVEAMEAVRRAAGVDREVVG